MGVITPKAVGSTHRTQFSHGATAEIAAQVERFAACLKRCGYRGSFDVSATTNRAHAAVESLSSPSFDGPRATAAEAARFIIDTLQHAADVVALTHALSGQVRVHDLDERVPMAGVKALVEQGVRDPKTGQQLLAPAWLTRRYEEARDAGRKTFDVSKLSPVVVAGLSSDGAPDPFAIALHRLSPHHQRPLTPEGAADFVNAVRMPRGYKQAVSFEMVDAIIVDQHRRGLFSLDDVALLRRASLQQRKLEREGLVASHRDAAEATLR